MEVLARNQFKVVDQYTLEDRPIHHSGAALFLLNLSSDNTITVQVEESESGETWSVVDIYEASSGLDVSVSLVPLGYATILFSSVREFVRVRLSASDPDGVLCHVVNWASNTPESPSSY